MARIRILPEIISNKIAAGEVVERPASVVKELVENAIDAGGERIVVEVEAGGRRLIRVADDGRGMDRDDALLALERYATSKIASDEDLFAIRSLGFRGEALPSIASVSRMTLISRPADQAAATEIKLEGGRILKVGETGAPTGTMVSVQDLFFNTPARRKFLKTVNTEMGHIGDSLASLALGNPQIDFRLFHNGKTVRRWPAATDGIDRVAGVLGRSLHDDLFPMSLENDAARVSGWVAAPRVNRSSSRAVHLFVNGRHVKDRTLLHAVMQGYRQRLMKGQFPVAVCHIVVPADQVDVNVHPSKHEVRFARQRDVHGVVAGAVAAALDSADRRQRPGRAGDSPMTPSLPTSIAEGLGKYRPQPGVMQSSRRVPPGGRPRPPASAPNSAARRDQTGLWQQGRFARLRVLGQFRGTYLLCESQEGLVIIDQHAAHERIFYEQLHRRRQTANAAAQKLLVPETVELTHGEAALLESLRGALAPLGFEIEPFGGTTYAVKAAPVMLVQGEIGPVIREILEKVRAVGGDPDVERVLDDSVKIMACHGAIRARQTLDERQTHRLLQQLDECENPSHCPHGRPTWIRWTERELEKAFGRQG